MKRLRLSTGGPVERHRPALLAGALGAGCLLMQCGAGLSGEIRAADGAQSLGTRINGGESCTAGACMVTGGTAAGRNLFHRFSVFDTRGAINNVSIQNNGYRSVMVGVTDPLGSFIDKPLSLSQPGQLYWLSPGGIQLRGAGPFLNVQQLNLSTATGLRVGAGLFDAVTSTLDQVARLDGLPGIVTTEAATLGGLGLLTNGNLSIDGGLLTVDQALLVDAQGGHLLLNGARLEAPGGEVVLTGASAELRDSVVNVSAPMATAGRVLVQSANNTLLAGATQLRAEGAQGGSVDVLGRMVTLSDQVAVLASGSHGGGQVRIGGDYLGGNPEVKNAWQTFVGPDVQVLANATLNGDGGRVIVWSDGVTRMYGTLQARGGTQAGNGGFIETSGREGLLLGTAVPDAGSPFGTPGTWLLDPSSITISNSGGPVPGPEDIGDFVVSVDAISAALQTNSVTLVSQGDIIWGASMTTSAVAPGAALTLEADGSIQINGAILVVGPSSLDLRFDAGQDVDINGPLVTNGGSLDVRASGGNQGGGQIFANCCSSIVTGGGRITFDAGVDGISGNSDGNFIDAGSGEVLFRSVGSINPGVPIIAGRIAAQSLTGNIVLDLAAPDAGPVRIGSLLNPDFFGSPLAVSGVQAPAGTFQVSTRSPDGLQPASSLMLTGAIALAGQSYVLPGIDNGPGISEISSLTAPEVIVEAGAVVSVSAVQAALPPFLGGVNLPMQFNADVDNRGSFSIDQGSLFIQGSILNQASAQLRVAAGADLRLPGLPGADLTLLAGSILSGNGSIIGQGQQLGLADLQQQAGAVVSPGAGDGTGQLGSIDLVDVAWNLDADALLRFELGSGGATDVDAVNLLGGSTLQVGVGGPIVQISLADAAVAPATIPLTFSLLTGGPAAASPDSLNAVLGPELAAMNARLQLADRLLGSLALGSLAFNYLGQLSTPVSTPASIPASTPVSTPTTSPPPASEASGPAVLLTSLDQPIIPPYDVKPSVLVNQPNAGVLGSIGLTIMLGESDLGLSLSNQDEDLADKEKVASALVKEDSSGQGRGASELTSALDRSVGLPIGSESRLEQLPLPSSAITRDMTLVISVDVSSADQVIQSLEKAEIRRIQDIQANIGGVEAPSGGMTELSSPALRQQLEAAARAVRAGSASSATGSQMP